jgi:GntR family transcriptional regulator/MocR family aminotransferase
MRPNPQQLLSMPASAGPLYLQIYHRIQKLILTGGWPPGTRLPSSRALADDLDIARNTAILALDKLLADGWIYSRPRSGMYVSADAPAGRPPLPASAANDCLSGRPLPFDIRHGAIDIFPTSEWSKIHAQVWRRSGDEALLEGEATGWMPLRQAIAAHLYAVRGIACSPHQILVVSSSRAALDLAVRVLGRPGDHAWVENPGYRYAREVLQAGKIGVCDVPVDGSGMDVAAALAMRPDARFACVTPACQFPTGAILGSERRLQLLDWARRSDRFIVEDDWDFNAVFDRAHALAPLVASASQQTLFIHSFNRLMFPALRIAALVVPLELVPQFVEARESVGGSPNTATQIALAEFIERGLLSAHLRQCRLAYAQRRDALHCAIDAELGDWLFVDRERAGLAAIAFARAAPAAELARIATDADIACHSLGEFSSNGRAHDDALVLGFGAFPPDMLREAAGQLAASFAAALGTPARSRQGRR